MLRAPVDNESLATCRPFRRASASSLQLSSAGTLRGVFLKRVKRLLSERTIAHRINFIWIDGHDFVCGAGFGVARHAHKKSLRLPRFQRAQLFRKSLQVGGRVECFQNEPGGRLMMAMVVVRYRMVSYEYIGTQSIFNTMRRNASSCPQNRNASSADLEKPKSLRPRKNGSEPWIRAAAIVSRARITPSSS